MDLGYEYGRRTSPNAKILALAALAVSGVLLALNANDKQEPEAENAETEVLLQKSTE